MCFFKDKKQQHIQLVQAHDDQKVTLQTSDESFHDANEEYVSSDDDFMHNYMVCVYKTSLQQTICSEFTSTGRPRSSRHGKCPRTMNMISLKINSLVSSL